MKIIYFTKPGPSPLTTQVSFLELYNEDMYDLLSANEDMNKLRLYEDPMVRGSVIINGIEDVIVTSKEQVLQGTS